MLAVKINDVEYNDAEIVDIIKSNDILAVALRLHQGLDPNAILMMTHKSGHVAQETPLYIALHGRAYDVFEFLLENGANINKKRYNKRSILHELLRDNRMSVERKKHLFDLAIERGGDVTIQDQRSTILHLPMAMVEVGGVEKVVRLGVDVNAKDIRGNTPLNGILDLSVAKSPWMVDLAIELVKNGAKLDIPNKAGITPMDRLNKKPKHELRDTLLALIDDAK